MDVPALIKFATDHAGTALAVLGAIVAAGTAIVAAFGPIVAKTANQTDDKVIGALAKGLSLLVKLADFVSVINPKKPGA